MEPGVGCSYFARALMRREVANRLIYTTSAAPDSQPAFGGGHFLRSGADGAHYPTHTHLSPLTHTFAPLPLYWMGCLVIKDFNLTTEQRLVLDSLNKLC